MQGDSDFNIREVFPYEEYYPRAVADTDVPSYASNKLTINIGLDEDKGGLESERDYISAHLTITRTTANPQEYPWEFALFDGDEVSVGMNDAYYLNGDAQDGDVVLNICEVMVSITRNLWGKWIHLTDIGDKWSIAVGLPNRWVHEDGDISYQIDLEISREGKYTLAGEATFSHGDYPILSTDSYRRGSIYDIDSPSPMVEVWNELEADIKARINNLREYLNTRDSYGR
jgi:hypothetical protein